MRIRYGDEAVADLQAIVSFGLKEGLRDPKGFVRRLRERLQILVAHPLAGRAGRVNGTRELPLAGLPYIAVYLVSAEAGLIDVVRILHGAQMWPATEDLGDE